MSKKLRDEWADLAPIPMFSTNQGGMAYPVDQLPDLLRVSAKAIAAHVQAPIALAAQCVIGAAAHLLQTRWNAPSLLSNSGMPLTIYQLSLGASGDRKSACRNLAFREIDRAEHDNHSHYLQVHNDIVRQSHSFKGRAREEFLLNNPLPCDPRTQFSDVTFEALAGEFIRGKSALTWDTDEGGQLLCGPSLRSDNSIAIVAGLCRGFDQGQFARQRAKGNLEGSGIAYNRRLSIHLLAQEVAVASALRDPVLSGQGFLPRFLFAAPDSVAGSRFLSEEMLTRSPEMIVELQQFWSRCRDVMKSPAHIDAETGEVLPPVLELSGRGQRVWLDFYNQIEVEQNKTGQYRDLRPFAGRAGEITRRLSAIFAGFEGATSIDEDMMSRACAITQHSLDEWLRYSESRNIDPLLVRAQHLLDWLRAKNWHEFHRDKLGKCGPASERAAKRRDAVLAVLVEHRQLLSQDGKNFHLNPFAETAELAETP